MAQNKEQKWEDITLKSLKAELRGLPEVEVPETLKAKLLAGIPGMRQKLSSIEHQLKWHLRARDCVATVSAAVLILALMLLVNYGLSTPSQIPLTELSDMSLSYTGWDQNSFWYDQNNSLIEDTSYINYNGRR